MPSALLSVAILLALLPARTEKLRIIPSRIELGPGRSCTFEASGTAPPGTDWRVGQGDGWIGSRGQYTAPRKPGTYRVELASQKGVEASAEVLVRPELVVLPQRKVGVSGEMVSFEARLEGAEGKAVQWYFQGARLPGNSPRMSLTLPTPGQYPLTVVAETDSRATATAWIQVLPPGPAGADRRRSGRIVADQDSVAPGGRVNFRIEGEEGPWVWATLGGGTIDEDGRCEAFPEPGSLQVVAMHKYMPGTSTVRYLPVLPVELVAAPSRVWSTKGQMQRFAAATSAGGVAWSLVPEEAGRMLSSGTFLPGDWEGRATITATSLREPTRKVELEVFIHPTDGEGFTGIPTFDPDMHHPFQRGLQVHPGVSMASAGNFVSLNCDPPDSDGESMPPLQWSWKALVDGGPAEVDSEGVFIAKAAGLYEVKVSEADPNGRWGTALVLVLPSDRPMGAEPEGVRSCERQAFALLKDGSIAMFGGEDKRGTPVATGWRLDSQTAKFSPLVPLSVPRSRAKAVCLADGSVLIVGGQGAQAGTDGRIRTEALRSAEWLDPQQGQPRKFGSSSATLGLMPSAHSGGSVTLLKDGRVLIAGGGRNDSEAGGPSSMFDPALGTFRLLKGPELGRDHAAALLEDGRVLLAGGRSAQGATASAAVWLFDPRSEKFSIAGSLRRSRFGHTATTLHEGKILIAGGLPAAGASKPVDTAEWFDPVSGLSSPAGRMAVPRTEHAALLLPTGMVMAWGGWVPEGRGGKRFPGEFEVYDPDASSWVVQDHLRYGMEAPVLIPLRDGSVYAGGIRRDIH